MTEFEWGMSNTVLRLLASFIERKKNKKIIHGNQVGNKLKSTSAAQIIAENAKAKRAKGCTKDEEKQTLNDEENRSCLLKVK